MIRAIRQNHGAAATVSRVGEFGQDLVGRSAMKQRPARKHLDSGIARRDASAFGRQVAVGGGGANDDPVGIVARLCRNLEQAAKGCACLQLDGIAAGRCIECLSGSLLPPSAARFGQALECRLRSYGRKRGATPTDRRIGGAESRVLRQGIGIRMVQHSDAEPSQNQRDSDRPASRALQVHDRLDQLN